MTTTKTATLQEFLADHAICRTWWTSIGCPTGCELIVDLDADDEDYCDSACLLEQRAIFEGGELEGEVTRDKDGEWRWEVTTLADSHLCDDQGNTILNLVVWGE